MPKKKKKRNFKQTCSKCGKTFYSSQSSIFYTSRRCRKCYVGKPIINTDVSLAESIALISAALK